MHKHVKGFRNTGYWHYFALDNGFIRLCAANYIVGLDSKDLEQNICCPERFKRQTSISPNL